MKLLVAGIVALIAIPLIIFGIASCGGPDIKEGTITRKEHDPESTFVMLIPIQTGSICSSAGKTTTCTPIFTPIPFVVHDDEDWAFVVDNGKDTGRVYVSRETWDSKEVGDYWQKSPGESFKDNHERVRRA